MELGTDPTDDDAFVYEDDKDEDEDEDEDEAWLSPNKDHPPEYYL